MQSILDQLSLYMIFSFGPWVAAWLGVILYYGRKIFRDEISDDFHPFEIAFFAMLVVVGAPTILYLIGLGAGPKGAVFVNVVTATIFLASRSADKKEKLLSIALFLLAFAEIAVAFRVALSSLGK